jgi:hypothetical protein
MYVDLIFPHLTFSSMKPISRRRNSIATLGRFGLAQRPLIADDANIGHKSQSPFSIEESVP